MTLAIGWLHDGGETVGTWLHQPGDWQHGRRRRIAASRALLELSSKLERVTSTCHDTPSRGIEI
jgi:hypothetical protein